MPTKPLRPCAAPSCPELTHDRYCPAHAHLQQQQVRQHTPEQRTFYSSTYWKKLRERVRMEEPTCRLCADVGRLTPSVVVDHIDGNYRHNSRENLQAICKACDAVKSARQHRAKQGEGGPISLSSALLAPACGTCSRERPKPVRHKNDSEGK